MISSNQHGLSQSRDVNVNLDIVGSARRSVYLF